MTVRILIVEDESDLGDVLHYNLKKEGFEPTLARSGAAAMAILKSSDPCDLVLLDLMLPDMSGMSICRHIRTNPSLAQVPVIILTARSSEGDRVLGFEMGADDYVVKPFSVRELILRIHALLRRLGVQSKQLSGLSFGSIRVSTDAHQVWRDGEELSLTVIEFRLLQFFLERPGRVQTRDHLLQSVWGEDVHVTVRTVDTHIKRLREKLGAAGNYIETVRGVGYRLASAPADGASN